MNNKQNPQQQGIKVGDIIWVDRGILGLDSGEVKSIDEYTVGSFNGVYFSDAEGRDKIFDQTVHKISLKESAHHPQQQESWSSFAVEGGGYIEFKDEENQKKCMALIQELISTERKKLLDDVMRLVEGMFTTLEKAAERYNPVPGRHVGITLDDAVVLKPHVSGYNSALDDLLSALKEMESKEI